LNLLAVIPRDKNSAVLLSVGQHFHSEFDISSLIEILLDTNGSVSSLTTSVGLFVYQSKE